LQPYTTHSLTPSPS